MDTITIGSTNDKFHVDARRYNYYRPGDVELTLWKLDRPGVCSSNRLQWIPAQADAAQQRAAIEATAYAMIESAAAGARNVVRVHL